MNLSSTKAMSCSSTCSRFSPPGLSFSFYSSNNPKLRRAFSLPRKQFRINCLRLSVEEISEVVHNKVLVASIIATTIGQLSKPLTKAAASGKVIDWRNAIRSGGMPSTHAASVVAAATTLGLERGFSDAIFGISVVFAGIVMYDAQGVRKEVGNHAQVINKIIDLQKGSSAHCIDRENFSKAKPGIINIDNSGLEISKLLPVNENLATCTSTVTAKQSDTKRGLETSLTDPLETVVLNIEPLSESVGHTRVQVFVGALLGFVIGLLTDVAL